MDFRRVALPDTLTGCLYLHSMPGRYEPLANTWAQAHRLGVRAIVCLVPEAEIKRHSPEYAVAFAAGRAPCDVWRLPIEDFGIPRDETAFVEMAQRAADALREGHSILVHCGAGIGRTGTFAVATLRAIGLDLDDAVARVREAGSGPERSCQSEMLSRLALQLDS